MAKLHKRKPNRPCPTRQIVSTPGSINHGPSKWVDFYLNPAMNTIPWVLKDSFQLIHNTKKNITTLHPTARLFTGNVKDCYTAINKTDAIHTIRNFLTKNIDNIILCDGIIMPIDTIIAVLEKNNE